MQILVWVVLVLLVAVAASLANSWPPTRPLRRLWDRYGPFVRWFVASAPATFVYLAVLSTTTWVLLGMPAGAKEAFLADQSTNLQHLTSDPLRVLVRSAFFVTKRELLAWIALFAMLLAPVERWLGSFRTITAFAIGHVGATALTALDIWGHIHYLHAPRSLWTVTDTGASYGFFTIAALLVYRLRGWTRIVLAALLGLVAIYGFGPGTGYTARGHALAILIGLALFPITRTARVRSRQGPGRSLPDLWLRRTADGPDRGDAQACAQLRAIDRARTRDASDDGAREARSRAQVPPAGSL